MSARCRHAAPAYPAGAFRPVPIAVAPRLISWISRSFGQAEPVLADRDGVGAEFLAERHGDGVLQLGAAHLHHRAEFEGFGGEGVFSSLRASSSSRAAKIVPSLTAVG